MLPARARDVHEWGAGTGLLTDSLVARGLRVIAVDPSASMLAELATRHPDVPRVVAAAEHSGQPDESADAVLVAQAWHWLDPIAAAQEAARVLRPGGLWLGNLADEPGRGYVARVAASAHACGLTHQILIATHDVLKGRRFGNSVLAASGRALDADELGRRLRRVSAPSGVMAPGRLARLRASARPLTDSDAHRSAPPPDPGRWRAR